MPTAMIERGKKDCRREKGPSAPETCAESAMPMLNRASGAQVEPSMELMRSTASGRGKPVMPTMRPASEACNMGLRASSRPMRRKVAARVAALPCVRAVRKNSSETSAVMLTPV